MTKQSSNETEELTCEQLDQVTGGSVRKAGGTQMEYLVYTMETVFVTSGH